VPVPNTAPDARATPGTGRTRRDTMLPTLALLAVTAAWGSSFVLVKDLVAELPVADFLAVRFAIAAVALWAIAPRAVGRLSAATRRHGVVLGLLYAGAQLLQTAGLTTISASVSGFVTGSYVVLTPLLAGVLTRERIGRSTWVAVGVATLGLAILTVQGFSIGVGEAVTFAAAVLYAAHIVGLGAWSRPGDAIGLATLQMAVIAVVCTGAALPGGIALPSGAGPWAAMIAVALGAGAFSMLAQTWAQAHLSATRAAIIMTMEPVFAAAFGVAIDADPVTWRLLVGGGLVLAAMYLAELGPRPRRATPPVARLPGE
jgi:drug/metabolite transporter (DMT)-like permease